MWRRRARVCVCVLAARNRATHSSECLRPTARCVDAGVVAACVAVARARVCVCVRVCVYALRIEAIGLDCSMCLLSFWIGPAKQRAIALRIATIALYRRRSVWWRVVARVWW